MLVYLFICFFGFVPDLKSEIPFPLRDNLVLSTGLIM